MISKRLVLQLFVFVPGMMLIGCGQSPTNPANQSAMTYTQLKSDVLTPKCVGCHGGKAGLFVLTHSSIRTFVIPGNPAGSLLFQVVNSNQMPPHGPPLTASEKQEISDWIAGGAMNN